MNDIYKGSSCAFFMAFLQICLALTISSCDSDSATILEEEECEMGETVSCDAESGNKGIKVCLPEGVYTECVYRIPKAGRPCSDLGEEYACACDGRLSGNMYCLNDSTYSECFCDSSSTSSPIGSAGSGGQETASEDGSGACPSPFSCEEIAQGGTVNQLCVDESQMPPFCESNSDCDAAGLEEAWCLDIGVGVNVCLQSCN